METISEIESRIAALQARPTSEALQQCIEHLERQRAQILSADKKEDRKNRSRALIILGSTVEKAAEESDECADWLRHRVSRLPSAR